MRVSELKQYLHEIHDGDKLVALLDANGKMVYTISVSGAKDTFYNKDVVILVPSGVEPRSKSKFEVVTEVGEDNTWPFKVKRQSDSKVLGKFKGAYLATMFCDFLEEHHDAIIEKQMEWARTQRRREGLI